MARLGFVSVVLLATVVTLVFTVAPANGQQWLANGDFESGAGGWFIPSGSPVACEAYQGNGALGVSATATTDGRIATEIDGPLPAATYTLSGWTRVQSGAGIVRFTLAFGSGGGSVTGITVPDDIPSGAEYTHFSVSYTVGFSPESASIAFYIDTETGAELCIDSLELTTPDPTPTPTLTPTSTSIPGETNTAVPSATVGTATATPSAPASSTPAKTSTPAPTTVAGPSFVFTNGGFEQGLAGWLKYGGTLTTTSGARSGSTAGLLTSNTASTKWAYQPVAIDPEVHYEFSGQIQTIGGVQEGYLRISWYATADASGAAIATTDSLERVTGSTAGYAFLRTGAVQPPPDAASARLRVVLAPLGDAAASVSIDDVTFGVVAPPTPTPSPTGTATATATPAGTPSPTPPIPLLGAAAATPDESSVSDHETGRDDTDAAVAPIEPSQTSDSVASSLAPTSEVAAVRSEARTTTSTPAPPPAFGTPSQPEPSPVPWPWLLGVGLFAVGLGGAYLQNNRTAR